MRPLVLTEIKMVFIIFKINFFGLKELNRD